MLTLPGGNITNDAATIILGGPGASFPGCSSFAVIAQAGSLKLGGGASFFTTAGNLDNSGTINLTPGTLNVNGTLTLESACSFEVGVGGTTAGSQFGQLNVTGQASVGGGLSVSLLNGFTPALRR